MEADTALDRVQQLNDEARMYSPTGRIVISRGIAAKPADEVADIMERVRTFEAFTSHNDPHGEHDFGNFTLAGRKFFWKIDYYDVNMEFGSEDPTDASKTIRVLTIMLAEEY